MNRVDETRMFIPELRDFFLPSLRLKSPCFVTAFHHMVYGDGWLDFGSLSETITARSLSEVGECIERVEAEQAAGRFAAGYVSYEASPAFDDAFVVRGSQEVPLAQFHIFQESPVFYKQLAPTAEEVSCDWVAAINQKEYVSQVARIRRLLAEGVTYQVNYTFRLKLETIDLSTGFNQLVGERAPPCASFFRSEDVTLACLSPELFFEQVGDRVQCRPMKGTASPESDLADLYRSEKNRAENLMVVDMVRNDLGRIAETGSVKTTGLFEVERYPTVLQMTSTIEASVGGGVKDVFGALFPSASIVGAPKVSTMRQIADLEASPRGIYTGAIGWVAPGRRAKFAVAIRTLTQTGESTTYGVGSGIVWDSVATEEWSECLLKAEALNARGRRWALLETMRWTPDEGFWLLERHLTRLADSAQALGVTLNRVETIASLERSLDGVGEPSRVRLMVSYEGRVEVETSALNASPKPLTARLAKIPVLSGDPNLRHKTTWRGLYDDHLRSVDADEVLLWNERSEVTEFCNGNVVLRVAEELVTPPLSCGLLPGTYRAELLESGEVVEALVRREQLDEITEVYRINALRGWQRVQLLSDD